jgi:hypothetical protein
MPVDEQEQPAGRQSTPVAKQGELVPVPVAARRLGKSPDAIRSAIRRGKLSGSKGNDGDWRVWLPIVELADIDSPPNSPQQDLDRTRVELAVALQQANDRQTTVVELRAELTMVRQQAADSAATVADLRERLSRIEGEADGNRRAMAAELSAKEVELAGKERMIVELQAQRDWHRQPFWRRWWG